MCCIILYMYILCFFFCKELIWFDIENYFNLGLKNWSMFVDIDMELDIKVNRIYS